MRKNLFAACTVLLCLGGIIAKAAGPHLLTDRGVAGETTIALAGNAFVISGTDSARITGKGLVRWTDASSSCIGFVRVVKTGMLKGGLRLRVPVGTSRIRLHIGSAVFERKISAGSWTDLFFGETRVTDTGYVKFVIEGLSRSGSQFAEVSDFLVAGEAAAGCQFANDPENFYWSRRGPSVHLNYTLPANENIEWFYNEVTVPPGEDKPGSFFMSNGFAHGYFGMQSRENDRWVLFSVWDPESGQGTTDPVEHGPEVIVQRFGGEGTGGQSYLVYNWRAGTTYKFLTRGRPDGQGNTLYSCWFYAPEKAAWLFIATWKRPHTSVYLSKLHSFLENFIDSNGWMERKANYNNQWIRTKEGNWQPVTDATFSVDATGRNKQRFDFDGGLDSNGQFFLHNGGFFNHYGTPGRQFTRASHGSPPSVEGW
ncbi:MAG: DUF3472 domain-containing protein [Flavihumibacter sp.]